MIEAKDMKVMEKEYRVLYQNKNIKKAPIRTVRKTNLGSKTNENVNLETCPCNVNDVYSLGMGLQDSLSNIFLELSDLSQGSQKMAYQNLALKELDAKEEIEKLAKANLNRLLSYFYNNGGPIIESPVSKLQARQIQPFFNMMANNFLDKLEVIVNRNSYTCMTASEMDNTIRKYVADMYTSMSKLFQADEIQAAFNELISIKNSNN